MQSRVSRNLNFRSALLLGAASITTLALAAPAMAQDQSVETVVVTGSRIPQTGLYSTSPVTSLGQQDMKLTGTSNLETVLRSLPAVVADTDNQFTNNGSGGLSLVDLRGLGNIRTLVLVDGKRLMPSDTTANVDISVIPPDLVDHVEVLTGGASAIYGSDAVAGVVNFILRKDFEGAEVDAQYGQTNSNDGQTTDVTGILGFNSANGKGNITIYGEYENRQPIFQGDRDYSKTALASPVFSLGAPSCAAAGFPTVFGGFCPLGSSSSQEGNFVPHDGNTYHATASNTLAPGTTFYNFNPVNYFQTPNTKYSFGATGHYEVSKSLDFYTRLTFSDSFVPTQLAPTPIISNFSTNFANPFLSNQERALLFACYPGCAPTDTATFNLKRRLVENGNRDQTFDRQMYQMVIGAKGDLGSGWSYDFSAQYGKTIVTSRLTGDAKFNSFQQGLLVGGTAANPVCLDPSGGCVPINIWTTNSISPQAVAFFTLPMDSISTVEQWDIQGSLVGDLGQWGIQSPWAKNPVAFSVGGEYRQEHGGFEPDDNLGTGNDLGFGQSAPVHGGYNVKEAFTELRVPLIENMPFAELLQVDGAYRYSSYNTAGPNSTYKYSAEWQPIDDIRFRGSVERAVRAPNIAELFGAQSDSANSGKDPCSAAGGAVVTTAALCEATGVPASRVFTGGLNCPSGQCNARVGGNPNLKPEVADTKSIGFVFTPTFIDGFNATVDYYDIKVDGFIAPVPLATVLQECYSTTLNPTQDPNNHFCQLVERNSGGELFGLPVPPGGDVLTLNSNIGVFRVKGWDFESNYNAEFADWGMDSSWGGFAINFKGTYTGTSDFQPDPTSEVLKCAGLYGDLCPDSAPTPKWRHQLRLTWFDASNDVSISLLWRHISETTFDEVKINGLVDPVDAHIPAFDWFDLSGTWAVNDRVSLRAGITNLFDKDPPLVDFELGAASVDSGNTFPGTYDPVGRTYFAGATIKF
ncbi:MAG: TonB-dependent receptor domain-containing protein [Rhizomicrobium sp.]